MSLLRRRLWPPLASGLLALLVAGCLGGGGGAGGEAPTQTGTDGEPGADDAADLGAGQAMPDASQAATMEAVRVADCLQFHLFLSFPADMFGPAPDGFTYVGSAPGTMDIAVFTSICEGGNVTYADGRVTPLTNRGSEWFAAPVVQPPADHRDPQYSLDLRFFELIQDSAEATHQYEAWGFSPTPGVIELLESGNTAGISDLAVQAQTSAGTYTVAGAVQGDAEWDASKTRVWRFTDGAPVGFLVLDNSAGPVIGAGGGSLTYAGLNVGGALPAHAGILHVVDEVDVTATWHPLVAAAPQPAS